MSYPTEDLTHHQCARSESWWARDAQGIELCRVCPECEEAKLSRYRPEILSGYSQADVDEPIEPEPTCYPYDFGL
jgi:hypothetical protein